MNAAPLLATLGFNLAHFFARMMPAAVVAVDVLGSGHGGIWQRMGLTRWCKTREGRLNAYRRGEFSTAVFSLTLASKVTTRRAVIGTAAPVLGFRPGRCGFSQKSKLPKSESFTPSPFQGPNVSHRKRLRPYPLLRVCSGKLCKERRSARSALVNVIRMP